MIVGSRTVVNRRQEANSKMKHEIGDLYFRFEGKVLRGSDEMRSCGISDGSVVQMMRSFRSGGAHKNKRSKAEKREIGAERRQAKPAFGRKRTSEIGRVLPRQRVLRKIDCAHEEGSDPDVS